MKTKKIMYVIAIIVVLWFAASTVAPKANWSFWAILANSKTQTETVVIDCKMENGNHYYTVTVEDANGNQWAYYDDEYRENGTEIMCTFNGHEIVDARED